MGENNPPSSYVSKELGRDQQPLLLSYFGVFGLLTKDVFFLGDALLKGFKSFGPDLIPRATSYCEVLLTGGCSACLGVQSE